MKIGIWHLTRFPFNGNMIRIMPSGGTETSIAYTAEALADMNHQISVYANTPEQCTINGVSYIPSTGLRTALDGEEFDAFVIVRHLAPLTVPVNTRGLFYWCHDNLDQPFLHGMFRFFADPHTRRNLIHCIHLGNIMDEIDGIFAVSRWQAQCISEKFRISPERIEIIGNGLQPSLFSPHTILSDKQPIVIYSLPPDRGLAWLLEIFIKAQRMLNELELHVYSRSTLYGESKEEDEKTYGKLYSMIRKIPHAHHFDPVDQRTLAHAISRAMVYAYPTETNETFCISLLEAQASGTVPVASDCGAISERIDDGRNGYLISGDPSTESVQEMFVEKIVELCSNHAQRIQMGKDALRKAHSYDYSYSAVAERFVKGIESVIKGKSCKKRYFDISRISEPYSVSAGNFHLQLTGKELNSLKNRFEKLLDLV